jgi:hypothetical protein
MHQPPPRFGPLQIPRLSPGMFQVGGRVASIHKTTTIFERRALNFIALSQPHNIIAHSNMAPILRSNSEISGALSVIVKRALLQAGPEVARLAARNAIQPRGLSVNSTQKTTLGVIIGYTVAIALLWNLPYVRWSLWPFKVREMWITHVNSANLDD